MQAVARRLSRCILGEEPFEPGMEYLSCLDLDGNRKDYCVSCWEKTQKPTTEHFWRGKIPEKKGKGHHPDKQALELFRQLEDPKKRFVIALYLQRKQQLLRRTQTLYEIPETGEIFDIEPIFISPEEGAALACEMHALIPTGD